MSISKIIPNLSGQKNNYSNCKAKKQNQLTFKSFNLQETRRIEAELARKGIDCNFRGDSFVGECTKKVVNLFENLFGRSSLPKKVVFREFSTFANKAYGAYNNIEDTVSINCNHDFFQNMQDLKDKVKSLHQQNQFSTSHPAHFYVHEFAHAAHWHNLESKLGFDKAFDVWRNFERTTVPTTIGNLVSRFTLGNYSVDGKDMCEFVAERATQDICNGLTSDSWKKCGNTDVGYKDLFDRRKTAKYFGHLHEPAYYDDVNSPQAFLDRFMQHAWNGNISEIKWTNSEAGEIFENLNWYRYIKNLFNI